MVSKCGCQGFSFVAKGREGNVFPAFSVVEHLSRFIAFDLKEQYHRAKGLLLLRRIAHSEAQSFSADRLPFLSIGKLGLDHKSMKDTMKSTLPEVHEFLSQRTLALAGVSRGGKKFGNVILKSLKRNGYSVFPIHPVAETIEGERCYSSLSALPEKVGGLIICLPSVQTERVLPQALAAGITRIWLQQGSESYAALRFCEHHGIKVVHGQCILMFVEPVESFHRFHRWVWRVIGKYPSLVPDGNQFTDPA